MVRCVAVFILVTTCCFTAKSQKKSFRDGLIFTFGLGASELNCNFGKHPDAWRTRFTYNVGLGHTITDRISMGIGGSVFVMRPSNGYYIPMQNGQAITKRETKGERCSLIGAYLKVIPFSQLKNLAIQLDGGLSVYEFIPDDKYFGNGWGYGGRISYNLSKDEGGRVEPYLAVGKGILSGITPPDPSLSDRNFIGYSMGLQISFQR